MVTFTNTEVLFGPHSETILEFYNVIQPTLGGRIFLTGLFDAKGISMLEEWLLLRRSAKVFVEHFTGHSKHPPDRAHMTTSNRTHHTGLYPYCA